MCLKNKEEEAGGGRERRKEARRNTRQQWIAEQLGLTLGWPGFTHCCWPPASTHTRLLTPMRYSTDTHTQQQNGQNREIYTHTPHSCQKLPAPSWVGGGFAAGSESRAVCRLSDSEKFHFKKVKVCSSSGALHVLTGDCWRVGDKRRDVVSEFHFVSMNKQTII